MSSGEDKKKSQVDPRNRSPETRPRKDSKLVSDGEVKVAQGERTIFSVNGAAKTAHPHAKSESRHRPYNF